jgi:hypothetical protein
MGGSMIMITNRFGGQFPTELYCSRFGDQFFTQAFYKAPWPLQVKVKGTGPALQYFTIVEVEGGHNTTYTF